MRNVYHIRDRALFSPKKRKKFSYTMHFKTSVAYSKCKCMHACSEHFALSKTHCDKASVGFMMLLMFVESRQDLWKSITASRRIIALFCQFKHKLSIKVIQKVLYTYTFEKYLSLLLTSGSLTSICRYNNHEFDACYKSDSLDIFKNLFFKTTI